MPEPTRARKELIVALRVSGCPVCRTAVVSVQRYLKSVFYEYVNDTGLRKRLHQSLGFCNLHAWQAVNQDLGNSLGFAMLYESVINEVLNRRIKTNSHNNDARALFPTGNCPACDAWDNAVDSFINLLVREFTNRSVVVALQESDGLCLSHLVQTLGRKKDWPGAAALLELHQEKLKDLQTELKEFIRKNDYRFSPEGYGSEADSWIRTISMINGLSKA
ncbi:MAG: DUF6062 family protein [Anaerolineales bacterium]